MTVSLPSRGLRGYGGAVLAGVISAAIFAFAISHPSSIFVIVNVLAGIPLFIVGLGAGTTCAALAAAVALVIISTLKTLDLGVYYYGLTYALPIVALTALAVRAKKGRNGKPEFLSEGYLLTAMAFYPCLVFLILAVAAVGQEGGILGFTLHALQTGLEIAPPGVTQSPEQIKQKILLVNMLARILPMLIACTWYLVMLLSIYTAQSALSQQKWNLRPEFEIQSITLPKDLFFGLIVSAALGILASSPYDYYGSNIAAILLVPYFFMGVGVVHAIAQASTFRLWILIAYYTLLSIPSIWTTPAMFGLTIVLGLIEQWFNLRQRFAAKQHKVRR